MGILLILFLYPKIEIMPRVIEEGKVYGGVLIEKKVLIKNIGDKDLKITNIKTGCFCILTILGKDLIKPGDSTTLLIKLRTGGEGEMEEYIFIESNDPYEPVAKIKISAEVMPRPRPEIEIKEVVNVGVLSLSEKKEFEVPVKNKGDADLIITGYEPSASCELKTKLPLTIPPKEIKVLKFELTPYKEGTLDEEVKLFTNIRGVLYHKIKIIGEVKKNPLFLETRGDTLILKNISGKRIVLKKKKSGPSLILLPGEYIKILK